MEKKPRNAHEKHVPSVCCSYYIYRVCCGESSLLLGKLGKSIYARNEPAIIAEI
jgi:hypothetical protein